jgi:hypothetical protein
MERLKKKKKKNHKETPETKFSEVLYKNTLESYSSRLDIEFQSSKIKEILKKNIRILLE